MVLQQFRMPLSWGPHFHSSARPLDGAPHPRSHVVLRDGRGDPSQAAAILSHYGFVEPVIAKIRRGPAIEARDLKVLEIHSGYRN
jgi:hypothetical protein